MRQSERINPTWIYLLLALLFALASAYVITQYVLESVQDRYLNQLFESGRQASDWMVREEDRLLGTENPMGPPVIGRFRFRHLQAEGIRERRHIHA